MEILTDSHPLDRVARALRRGIEKKLHLGGQIYVSLQDKTCLDHCFGEARPGEPMTDEHLPIWFSSGKPVAAVAIAQLWEQSRLALDDTVAAFVPEFGTGGKRAVTIRHLLTHTGGFRMLDTGWPEMNWEEIVQNICHKRLEPRWVPGVTAGYHRTSSWFILGEIVRRVDGRPFETYVREEIFVPLGMHDSWIGMPIEQYRHYGGRIAPLYNSESDEASGNRWDSESWVTSCSPGANARGPVHDLHKLYQMLLAGGSYGDTEILAPQTVEALTARHRVGTFDKTFQAVLDWGLGFVKNSSQYGVENFPYDFGRYASARIYGHSGYRSSIAFADPVPDLVVALAVNGTPSETDHRNYIQNVVEAVYEDLELTTDRA